MKVILFSSGAYSDYSVHAILEWLKPEVTPEQSRDRWLEMHPEQKERWKFDQCAFMAWLVREGIAQDAEAEELWIGGGYGAHPGEILHEWERKPMKRYEE